MEEKKTASIPTKKQKPGDESVTDRTHCPAHRPRKTIVEAIISGCILFTIGVFVLLGIVMTIIPDVVQLPTGATAIGALQVAGGDRVVINQETESDLLAAGNQITVNSPIRGDVLAAGGRIDIDAVVDGDVRSIGQQVTLHGVIKGNVLVVGQRIWIRPGTRIDGHLNIIGADIVVDGTVQGKTDVRGTTTEFGGIFDRSVNSVAGSTNINQKARFKAPANFETATPITIAPGVIGANHIVNHTVAPVSVPMGSTFFSWIQWHLKMTGWWMLLGVLLIAVAPAWIHRVGHSMHARHFQTWRKGLVWFLATPTALLVLFLTVVGAPLALLGSALYIALLLAGQLLAGMMLGLLILRLDHEKIEPLRRRWYLIGEFLVGYGLLSLLMAVPVFGQVIGLAASVWGLGGILWHYHEVRCRCGGICCGLVD